jgi:Uma2 family endonuclease
MLVGFLSLIKDTHSSMEAVIDQLSDYELERGKPMPDTIHAAIQANLSFEIKLRYRNTYRVLSELSLATTPDSTTPDLALYPAFNLDYEHRSAKRTDAPLTCIEIQSPSQSNEEMVDKTAVYFNFGVRSCWIVVPAMKGIFVYDRPGHYAFFHDNDTLLDPALSIELPLSSIFE